MKHKIFIRVDSSTNIGTGHVIRCLALAKLLKERFLVSFICRNLTGNICNYIENNGFKVFLISGNYETSRDVNDDSESTMKILEKNGGESNLLIIDHYGLGKDWESKIHPLVNKIVVIDDLANREHCSDLLIDQNLYENMEKRYENLVSKNCVKLLGPQYALLRTEFKMAKKRNLKQKNSLNSILISFGGSDPSNETEKVLKAIQFLDLKEILINVIAGFSNPNKISLKNLCSKIPNTFYYDQVDDISQFMIEADLAIGGGGSTMWERCCLGLPAIVSILAENQRLASETLANKGCIINLGIAKLLSYKDYVDAIKKIDSKTLSMMSKNCMSLVDGEGTTRVANEIFSLLEKKNA